MTEYCTRLEVFEKTTTVDDYCKAMGDVLGVSEMALTLILSRPTSKCSLNAERATLCSCPVYIDSVSAA